MKLHNSPFQEIKAGRKTIEMRLCDEKRAKLCVGEQIQFTNIEDGKTLICDVIALYRYSSFRELYLQHDKISLGYAENESADPADMLAYYSEEDIRKFGVIGIQISPT